MLLTDERSNATRKRIQAAVEAGLKGRGVSGRRASLDVVGNDGLVRDIRAGVMPAIDRLEALFLYLGIGFDLAPALRNEAPAQLVLEGKDYARLPVLDAALSAGPGAANGDDLIVDHLAFKSDWLRRLHLSPSRASLVRVHGDSMRPTLQPGDIVLLDTSDQARDLPIRTRPQGKGRAPIYGLSIDGEARVKRLLRPDRDTLILLSDNSDWTPEVWSGARLRQMEPAILGKVVWWGHTEGE